jgi:hypothetical protein
MNIRLRKPLVVMAFALIAARAEAVPLLQLDVLNGVYDTDSDTIVASGEDFTLVAILTPGTNAKAAEIATLLANTYYVSAALIPGEAQTSGSFSWNNNVYNVTSDMTYGTPPFEAGDQSHDSGDLSTHGAFPAYFREFAFQFTATQRALRYDSERDPGALTPTSATKTISYYMLFDITTSVGSTSAIHFDLYNTVFKECAKKNPGCVKDEDVGQFAPFSHDAESGHSPDEPVSSVPEPSNLMLIGIGVVAAARVFRRHTASGPAPPPEG